MIKKLLHYWLLDDTANGLVQFFRYGLVGGISFIVDWAALFLFERLGLHYLIAAIVGFLLGLTVNFTLSVQFVFRKRPTNVSAAGEFVVYCVIGAIGLGLTELFMYLLTEKGGLHFLISKIFVAAIVLIWNFLARKLILYRNEH